MVNNVGFITEMLSYG